MIRVRGCTYHVLGTTWDVSKVMIMARIGNS